MGQHSGVSPVAVFASVGEAVAAAEAALSFIAAADPAEVAVLPAVTLAAGLRGLTRAESAHVAARSRLLSAFTAQAGSETDGHPTTKSWLRWQTRVTSGAAAGEMGWMRRLAVHPLVAAALAAGAVSPSWGRQVCEWTDLLPPDLRDDADQILLAALAGGADLADARGLFREMLERTAPPASDGGAPGAGPGDGDDGFADRSLRLDLHWRGAGYLTANLTPECAAALLAVLESLGKKAGPEDDRTPGQRNHDALEEACRLLVSGGLPDVAGQPTLIQLHATLDQLRDLAPPPAAPPAAPPGARPAASRETPPAASPGAPPEAPPAASPGAPPAAWPEAPPAGTAGDSPAGDTAAGGDRRPGWAATGAFLAGRASGDGQPGWMSRAAAEAYACDAKIAPVITGHIDPAALAAAVRAFLYRQTGTGPTGTGPPGYAAGTTPPEATPPEAMPPEAGPPGAALPPDTLSRLHATLVRYALDILSGPAGLAAQLRTQLPGILGGAVSLPLDVGAPTATVPPHLRRAVTTRDRHCAFPGCTRKPANCQVHHLIPRAKGGVTALPNLALLCDFHHLIAVHRWGWTLTLNADGTTTATSPDRRRAFHSHAPPGEQAA